MIAKFGAIVTDARGKLGGHVFTRAVNGNTVRTLVKPRDRRSTTQQTQRNRFGFISSFWKSLDPAEKQAWEDARPFFPSTSSVGTVFLPPAHSLFVELAGNQFNAFGAFDSVPNTNTNFTQIDTINLQIDIKQAGMDFWVVAQTGFGQEAFFAYVDATNFTDSVVVPDQTAFRNIATWTGTTNQPQNFGREWDDVFGDISPGSTIWVRVRQIASNGRVGQAMFASAPRPVQQI